MRSAAVLAFPGISPFHLSAPLLVLGSVGLGSALAAYRTEVVAERPGPLPTAAGLDLVVEESLDVLRRADVVVIPSWDPDRVPGPVLLDAVRAAHDRGARIVGLCLGAFVVAASGIAVGREVSTHWASGERLDRDYPGHLVRTDVLWSDLGDVVTSAGVAAALDCCLHVVRTELGSTVAADLARAMVMAPHRVGSQAQFLVHPVPVREGGDEIDRAMAWALERLAEPIDLESWARGAHLSRRTLTRRFRDRTGTSPGAWLQHQRLDHARRLLESSDLGVDVIAGLAGFGSAVSLRHHFRNRFGTTPGQHRRTFAGTA